MGFSGAWTPTVGAMTRSYPASEKPFGATDLSYYLAVSTDFDLLDAWGNGDKAAASELFKRHFRPIYRFFRNKINDGAEDLVQQTFLACIESRDKFRRDSSFRTYMFATARNILYKEYRRRRRHDDRIDFTEKSAIDLGPSPSSIIAKKAEERVLLEALRSIPMDYQVALELYMWEDLSGKELAGVLGLSEDGARSRVHRAKAALRKKIEELSESPERLESTLSGLDTWAKSLRELAGADS
jgi:RNA polymerase sigma-70 factor (ECF subfamily)